MWRADRVHELVLAICAGTALVVKPGDSVWSFCEIGKKKSAYVQRGLVESVPKEGSVSIKDRDKPLYGVSFAGVTQVCIPLYLSTLLASPRCACAAGVKPSLQGIQALI